MDAMKRVEDLMNMVLDEGGNEHERLQAAVGMARIIREYKLLGKKHVDVAVNILDRFTSPDFVEGVASRMEKIGDGFARVMGVAKKVSNLTRESRGDGDRHPRRRRRRRI